MTTPTPAPPTLPERVTATLVDAMSTDGSRIYRIADERGYTHMRDTLRITQEADSGRVEGYTVYTMRSGSWTFLLDGKRARQPNGRAADVPWDTAVQRAVAVLYGMEKHG